MSIHGANDDQDATQPGGAAAWIGVDVGGTKIDGVLVDAAGGVLAETHALSGVSEGTDAVIGRIAGVIRSLITAAGDRPIPGVGVGVPGQVNTREGVARAAVNMGWMDVPLRARLLEAVDHPGLEVVLANDVNALALGEARFGLGQGARGLVYLAVGTGLGGGAVFNGQVIAGDNDFAMEVGHMALRPDGRRCGCGLHGCPEAYVSGVGILSGVREQMDAFPNTRLTSEITLTVPIILREARAGDPLALRVMDEAGEMLGTVMAICAALLNPDLFVIGGGLGRAAADLLLPRAEAELRARVLPPSHERAKVMLAKVERAAIGAAALSMV
jgi:glucokinase